MKYTVAIEGMGCEKCVMKVKNALASIGAAEENVQIGSAVCEFSGDEESLRSAIEDAGFDVLSVKAE